MKKRGISLIVLIITIVVMIILATAIILNITNTNMIGKANMAVFKSDVSAMKDELSMYISDKYMETVGEYEPEKLQATEEGIWYGSTQEEGIITDILKSMNEKYIGKLFIQDGKLVANKMTITVEEEKWLDDIGVDSAYKTDIGKIEIIPSTAEWINGDITLAISYTKEIPQGYVLEYKINDGKFQEGTQVLVEENNTKVSARLYNKEKDNEAVTNSYVVSNIDKEVPTNPQVEIVGNTENSIIVKASGSIDSLSGLKGYSFSIDQNTWVDVEEVNGEATYTFIGIKSGIETTIYAKAYDDIKVGTRNESEEVSNKGTTTSIGQVSISQSPAATTSTGEVNWTSGNVTVTLSHAAVRGYTLQYKLSGGMTQNWTTYSSAITIDTNNTTVATRMYNSTLDDEGNSANTKTISNIDKENPTEPTSVSLSVTENSVTATATGSTDTLSGFSKYQYSLNNSTWQDSNVFTDLDNITTYTIYARAVDKVGNVSGIKSSSTTTKYEQVNVNVIVTRQNATITGELPIYNNPVIPVGFKAKDTKDASWDDTDSDGIVDDWNNGLVIADENGNEFVWVPVDGTDVKYEKWCRSGISYSNTSDDTEALPTVNGSTINENLQIIKYGGFYIGRYEAGVPANQTSIDGKSSSTSNKAGIPVTKQGATVWTCISYKNANTNAKSFVNTTNVKSGLVTGTQWDTVMKWMSNSGISITDSRSWGNYSDSITPANVKGYRAKQVTGYSEYWKAKNIYDLAGNTWEWTGEIYNSLYRIHRDGGYNNSGFDLPASYRDNLSPSGSGNSISFRLVLYVM